MAVVLAVFSLIGGSIAVEEPAPSPASSAGAFSPSFAVGCLVTFATFLFGSEIRI